MELKDYIRVIRRRLWWFVVVMLVVIGGYILVATVTEKKIFQVGTRLIIISTRTGGLLEGLKDFFPNGIKMNFETRVETLASQEIAELAALYLLDEKAGPEADYLFAAERREVDALVDGFRDTQVRIYQEAHPALGKEEILATYGLEIEESISRKRVRDPQTGKWSGEKGRWQEACVKLIGSAIRNAYSVSRNEKTQIVDLSVQSDSGAKVVAIANAVTDAAIDYHSEFESKELEAGRIKAGEIIKKNRESMEALRQEIKDFWERHRTQGEGESNTLDFHTSGQFYALMAGVQSDIDRLRGDLLKQKETREKLDKKRSIERQKFPQFSLPKDSGLSALRQQWMLEEKRLESLRERYTDAHPEIKKSQRTLDEFKHQYNEDLRKFQENETLDHEYQKAMLEFEQASLLEEIQRKRELLDKYDKARLRVDNLKLDEEERKSRLEAYEAENKRLTQFLGLAELYADNSMKPVVRWSHPRTPKDAIAQRSETFDMLWFMFVVAFLLSLGVVFLVEYMDTTLKTEHDIRRHLNLPVLGIIHHQPEGESVLLTELPTKDPFAEKFYTAATIVKSAAQDLNLKTFVVSSTIPKEGKTTITVNLGVALARKGLKVILVDADLRIPQIHELMGLDNAYGLSSILEGRLKAREVLADITGAAETRKTGLESFLQTSPVENLQVLTGGPIPPDPLHLLESVRMRALIEELKGMADFVLLDTPPIANVGDTLTLAGICDANIFVVGAGAVEQHQVTWAKHLLSNVEANVLGCFLNHATIEGRSYYYYYNEYKSYRARG
jgi:capsular exopolysaccharide synthesis family protein